MISFKKFLESKDPYNSYIDIGHYEGLKVLWIWDGKNFEERTYDQGFTTHQMLFDKDYDIDETWRGRHDEKKNIISIFPPWRVRDDWYHLRVKTRVPGELKRILKKQYPRAVYKTFLGAKW